MLKVEFHREMTPNRVYRLQTNAAFVGLLIQLWDAFQSNQKNLLITTNIQDPSK